MEIVRDGITLAMLAGMAVGMFGDLVKAVVDVERGIMAVNAELHADEEALLLSDGSSQAICGASTCTRRMSEHRASSNSSR